MAVLLTANGDGVLPPLWGVLLRKRCARMCTDSREHRHVSHRIGGPMAVGDVENLAARMLRISQLTETLLAVRIENERARVLADQVDQEIAVARLQIRLYTPPMDGARLLSFAR